MTPAVVAAFLLASDLPTKPTAEPQSAKELYNAWRWYGLPLPPQGAKLIRWEAELQNQKTVRLGVLIQPLANGLPARVRYFHWGVEPEFRPSRLKGVPPIPKQVEGWDYEIAEAWVELAATAWHLGWEELARVAFERSRQLPGNVHASDVTRRDGKHILHTVQRIAWMAAYYDLMETGTDRHSLLAQMTRIARDYPEGYAGELYTRVPERLAAALKPSTAEAGSVESLINGLTDETLPDVNADYPLTDFRNSTCYARLAERGFEAVPALLAHMADERVTRHGILCGFGNNGYTEIATVGYHCRALLLALSNGQIHHGPDERRADYLRDPHEWFRKAGRIGEEV